MKYYANIQNKKLNGCSQCKCQAEGLEQIEISKEIFENIERYYYEDGKIKLNENYDIEQKKLQRKEEIIQELDNLDLKSIRALRADETEKLEELEKQAIELRKELGEL